MIYEHDQKYVYSILQSKMKSSTLAGVGRFVFTKHGLLSQIGPPQ